ncbi:hypothetical protein [Phaeodactylibacter luteus]|uniref:Uncharacterized protein n=1 Tax=Phaeodactylibacter luteus TaxID=1564516 RepID=A0A5C6RTC7_9BACT|nr:hypothetical protein [Phaeodactylibacter luteus]TXB65538.1 hypothetical protein FRY97_06035 [Phaeodactylibacter luteus]
MPLHITNIKDQRLRRLIEQVYERFSPLHPYELEVRQHRLRKTTMNAQPVVDARFWQKARRRYRINIGEYLQLPGQINLAGLPREVMSGWLAHEMGHLCDYRERSAWGMMKFGIGYWWLANYRSGAERQADLYAIRQGFGDELQATKIYILEQSPLPDAYKSRIRKYYMSVDEVAQLIDGKEHPSLRLDQLI